jgi:hypothetical protein
MSSMNYVFCSVKISSFLSVVAKGERMKPNPQTNRRRVHCKKRFSIFPSPAGMSPVTKLSLAGKIIKLFPARVSLVSAVPAGEGKIGNLFLQCREQDCFRARGLSRPYLHNNRPRKHSREVRGEGGGEGGRGEDNTDRR